MKTEMLPTITNPIGMCLGTYQLFSVDNNKKVGTYVVTSIYLYVCMVI